MFYLASKIFWIFASPINLLLLAALIGTLFSRVVAIAAILTLIVVAVTPAGLALIRILEDRFPVPPPDMAPPYGLIILGGGINGPASQTRGQVVFEEEGERVVEAAILAKRYPDARIVFTGASVSLTTQSSDEALAARRLLVELGVSPSRIALEDQSRNTDENAKFTAKILGPEISRRWLLVTSAFHMPRSIGLFEKAGFNVVAYPVAFRTYGPGYGLAWDHNPARNLRVFEIAMKEFIGLAAYWATGRIDRVFPGPDDVRGEAGTAAAGAG